MACFLGDGVTSVLGSRAEPDGRGDASGRERCGRPRPADAEGARRSGVPGRRAPGSDRRNRRARAVDRRARQRDRREGRAACRSRLRRSGARGGEEVRVRAGGAGPCAAVRPAGGRGARAAPEIVKPGGDGLRPGRGPRPLRREAAAPHLGQPAVQRHQVLARGHGRLVPRAARRRRDGVRSGRPRHRHPADVQ